MNVYILSINIIKFICCIKIVEYILLERELKKIYINFTRNTKKYNIN